MVLGDLLLRAPSTLCLDDGRPLQELSVPCTDDENFPDWRRRGIRLTENAGKHDATGLRLETSSVLKFAMFVPFPQLCELCRS